MLKFESFTYPFLNLANTADHEALVRSVLSVPNLQMDGDPKRGLKALYVHIPFCDTICLFCPFNKTKGTAERIAAYLQALLVELRTLGQQPRIAEWALDAIYIGGGTPSVLTIEQISDLFAAIRRNFTIAPDAEISFEFEVKSMDEAKFAALARLGVTRVSFGAQTFHPETRKFVNLTPTVDQLYEAIGLSTKYFTNTNLDMMCGFPGQDLDAALHDAHLAATSGIGSVSAYPLDYLMTLPGWQDRIRSGRMPRPVDLDARSAMFQAFRLEIMRSMAEQNMYCFGEAGAPPTRYMFSTLYGGYRDEAVGAGLGAYSLIRGHTWGNEPDEESYIRRVLAGQLPVSVASPYHALEKGLVFFPKRLRFDMADLDILGLTEIAGPKIDEIVAAGYATVVDGTLHLTDAGKPVYSELMAHFFSDAMRRLYLRMVDRMGKQIGMIDAEEWAGTTGPRGVPGAISALPHPRVRSAKVPQPA